METSRSNSLGDQKYGRRCLNKEKEGRQGALQAKQQTQKKKFGTSRNDIDMNVCASLSKSVQGISIKVQGISRKLWVAWIWKASTRSLSESGVYAEVMDPSRCGVLLGSDKHGMVLGPWLLPVSCASLWKRAPPPWSTLHDLLWYHRSKTTNQQPWAETPKP